MDQFGSHETRGIPPQHADGYLPIVEVGYRVEGGVVREECFAGRINETSEAVGAFLKDRGRMRMESSIVRFLTGLYACHGLRQRKHLPESYIWTDRVPTVVDLDRDEAAALRRKGDAALETYLRSKGCFPLPALKVRELAPLCRETFLVSGGKPAAGLFAPEDRRLQRLATRIVKEVRSLTGVTLSVCRDDEFRVSRSHPLLLGALLR
jgi:hypothetical protein